MPSTYYTLGGYVDRKIMLNMVEYTVSKNDTGVAHYNFDIYQPILIIFGRDIAVRMIKW